MGKNKGKEREKMIWIDLSQKIENNMPVYPGDKEVSIEKVKDYNEDGYNMYVMESQFHSGTHVECPMHLSSSKKYISDFSVERFCGSAVLLDVRESNENAICFYKAYGFLEDGIRKNFYENPREHAILMSKDLAKDLPV